MIVRGRLKQRLFETRKGEQRTVVELVVDEVGLSPRSRSSGASRPAAPATTVVPTRLVAVAVAETTLGVGAVTGAEGSDCTAMSLPSRRLGC